MNLIIIAGLPATGKSTLAKKLSEHFQYPIMEKDEIKELLFDTVGYANLAAKRALDRGATDTLLYSAEILLKSGSSLILVNNFESSMSERVNRMIASCNANTVTVFLTGNADVLHARYVERDKNKKRHQGHTFIDRYPPLPGDNTELPMTREYFAERFEREGMSEFKIIGERIEIDATEPSTICVAEVIRKIENTLKITKSEENQ
jgi:predicted kinase